MRRCGRDETRGGGTSHSICPDEDPTDHIHNGTPYSANNIRVLPRMFGLTYDRSRNSATPVS